MPRAGFTAISSGKIRFGKDGLWYSDDEVIPNRAIRRLFSQALRATRATASVMARDLVGSRPQDALAERDPRFIRETLEL